MHKVKFRKKKLQVIVKFKLITIFSNICKVESSNKFQHEQVYTLNTINLNTRLIMFDLRNGKSK